MSLKKILLKGTTRMSLHERFSSLRRAEDDHVEQRVQVQAVHRSLFSDQPPASARNRKLAQSMDRRPTVIAALRMKKQLLRYRMNQSRVRPRTSIKDRLTLRGRLGTQGRLGIQARVGGIRGRVRGGMRGRVGQRPGAITGQSPLSRPQSRQQGTRGIRRPLRGNISRSQSVQSLNSRRGSMARGGGGGGRIGNNRFQDRISSYRQEFRRGGGRGLRSRGGYNRNQDEGFRSGRGGRFNDRGGRSRGLRSRGGRGARGGTRGGRGRGGRGPPPSREELDTQLDQYMSRSRGNLDRDLDTYMSTQENWD